MKASSLSAAALALLLAVAGPVSLSGAARAEENAVLAVVNGDEIRQSDIAQMIEDLPPQYRQLPVQMLMPSLIQRAVDGKLLAQAARAQGLAADEEVQRRLAFYEDRILQEIFLTRKMKDELTEERLRAAFEKKLAGLEPEDEVHARHILLETEEDAKAVIEELEGGADFTETAKARSTGPSAPQGGDLGFFTKGQMVAPFSEAAFAMAKGGISKEPVKTQFGWHVIKVEDRRKAAPPSFEELEGELRNQVAQEIIQAMVDGYRKDAKIEIKEPAPEEAPGQAKKAKDGKAGKTAD